MKSPRTRRAGALTTDRPIPILDGFASSTNSPLAKRGIGSDLTDTPLPGKVATATETRTSVRFEGDHAAVASAMTSLLSNPDLQTPDGIEVEMGGEGFVDEPRRTTTNLPAVIATAIARKGDLEIVPNWHQVQNLPGYGKQAIRNLGRMVFSEFTPKELNEIQTLSMLTNTENEVKGMMAWITKNGVREQDTEMDFSQIMPGVTAVVQLWRTEGFSFLLVKDNFSHYIYGWAGDRGVHLEQRPEPLRLR